MNESGKRKDSSLCIYESFLLYLSLCRLVVRLYLDWKADLFFITLGHSLRSQRSACKLMVPKKTKTDLMGVFDFRYIYNTQITAYKVLCTDFYSRVARLWKTNE